MFKQIYDMSCWAAGSPQAPLGSFTQKIQKVTRQQLPHLPDLLMKMSFWIQLVEERGNWGVGGTAALSIETGFICLNNF